MLKLTHPMPSSQNNTSSPPDLHPQSLINISGAFILPIRRCLRHASIRCRRWSTIITTLLCTGRRGIHRTRSWRPSSSPSWSWCWRSGRRGSIIRSWCRRTSVVSTRSWSVHRCRRRSRIRARGWSFVRRIPAAGLRRVRPVIRGVCGWVLVCWCLGTAPCAVVITSISRSLGTGVESVILAVCWGLGSR